MMNTRVEMNEEMMMQVNGGYKVNPAQKADYDKALHPGCGGNILHRWNPVLWCECDRCGEKHGLFSDFYDVEFDFLNFLD